jgi:hypothetical protein
MKTLNACVVPLALGVGAMLVTAVNARNKPSPTDAYFEQLALAWSSDCNVGPGSPEPQCCPSGYCEDS